MGGAGFHAGGARNHLGPGFDQNSVTRYIEQRCARIVGDRDRNRSGGSRRTQGADRVGRGATRRDPEHNVIRADLCIRHGARAGRLVVLGALGALD